MSEESLTTVFVGMRQKILRFASRFFPDDGDAADALQDAFCRLWPRRGEIATAEEAEALAKTAVRNLGIDAYRRRQANPTVAYSAAEEPAAPEDPMDLEERWRAVERIVEERLTEVQRAVFRMKEYEGLGYDEIAARLGMREPAVRMQLSRARKTIRECYYKNKLL